MLNKKEKQNLEVLKACKRIRKIIDEIGGRNGFIYGNVELIDTAIGEIDALITNEEYMANPNISLAVDEFADSYKRLRGHYNRLTT